MSLPKNIKDVSKEGIKSLVKFQLSLIGPVGVLIDEILFGIGDRIRGKRLEEFVKVLSEQVDKINENKIDNAFLNSEDFYDLTVNILNSAVKSKSKEKHKILASIFVDALNKRIEWDADLAQTFIMYVNDFTPKHILVFKYLLKNLSALANVDSYEALYLAFIKNLQNIEIDKYEFRMYLRDIENKTLMRFSRDVREYGSSGGYIALENYEEVQGIILTSIGEKFAAFLEE